MSKQKKHRNRTKALHLVNTSLLAVSVGTGIAAPFAGSAEANPATASEQPSVYTGDSLSYFQAFLNQSIATSQLTTGEDAVSTPGTGTGSNVGSDSDADSDSDAGSGSESSQPSTSSPTAKPPAKIGASHSDSQTPDVATVELDGEDRATIRLLPDEMKTAAAHVERLGVVTLTAPDLKGKTSVRVELPGPAVAALADKASSLAVQTGDVGVRIPTFAVPIEALAADAGVPAESLQLRLEMKRVEADALPALPEGYTLRGAAYAFSLTAVANGAAVEVPGFDRRFATMKVPLAEGLDPARAAGYILENGVLHPVPVTIDGDGVHFHSTLNGTFLLLEAPAARALGDAETHWAKDAIRTMTEKGFIAPDADGAFRPDGQVSRAEFASLLTRALGLAATDKPATDSRFADIAADDPHAASIDSAVKAGLFRGVAADRFAPDQWMTREQMAAVLVRAADAYGLTLPQDDAGADASARFADFGDVSDWAKEDVAKALRSGLIQGFDASRLGSADPGTRSQSAVLLLQLLQKAGLLDE
jgi:hypothetical protein